MLFVDSVCQSSFSEWYYQFILAGFSVSRIVASLQGIFNSRREFAKGVILSDTVIDTDVLLLDLFQRLEV